MEQFDSPGGVQPPSPFNPTPLTPSTPKKDPSPFPSTSPDSSTTPAAADKGLEPWMKLLGPGATVADAEKFRAQTMNMGITFIKHRLDKMREDAKENNRQALYGE